jgi:hypothetical protein
MFKEEEGCADGEGVCPALSGIPFGANDFIALDDGGDADPGGALIRFLVDSNHLAHRPNENL